MSKQPDLITLACPAKVNLALSVGLADLSHHAMHPISSLMVSLDYADELQLAVSDTSESTFDIQFDDKDHLPNVIDWPLEKDLAYRAWQYLQKHTNRLLPINLKLQKKIPTGAGLGGGSSNAASVLVGLNRLFQLAVADQTLIQMGLKLGSDVGFLVSALLNDSGAIVGGFGDQIQSIQLKQPLYLVLLFPPFGCPTGLVYQAFDQLRPRAQLQENRVQSLAIKDVIAPLDPFNDLAVAACSVRPALETLQKKATEILQWPVHITGSGSTLFAITALAKDANRLARKVQESLAIPTIVTCTRQ